MSDRDAPPGTWVTFAEDRPSTLEIRRFRLSVVQGADAGLSAGFDSGWIRVGAHPACDMVLTDRKVSGHHFEIQLDEHGFRLRDLGSTNGTFVAGLRLRDAYLSAGSVVYVGDSRISFEPLDVSVSVALYPQPRFGDIVGGSVPMRALFARLERIAATDAGVLITGETGTGKELIAEAIHDHSTRAAGPFIVLDCGALPANLIESELFGHERGAFTGAVAAHVGVFERAHGGTVFLDELGELPLELQPKLLGVLERKQIRRIGGTRAIPIDVRVVAATNRQLAHEMNRGGFRSDLFYRVAVVQVHLPPLRERMDDIPLLVEHFLAMRPGDAPASLTPDAIDGLMRHDFPGNVRELRNMIERSLALAEVGDQSPWWTERAAEARDETPTGDSVTMAVDETIQYKQAKASLVEAFDRRYLRRLLKRYGGNVSQAARAAGIDRMTIHKMIARYGLINPR